MQQVGFLNLVHEPLLILLGAQAVAQLLSSLKARLVSLGGSLGCSLQVSPEAGAQLLQAGVFTLQGAQPLLQVLHQSCQLGT